MSHFLHISIAADDEFDADKLKDILDKAINWIQYIPGCWIVRTKRDSRFWYRRIRPLMKDSDRLFIAKVDLVDRQGWLPKWVWEWIEEYVPQASRPIVITRPQTYFKSNDVAAYRVSVRAKSWFSPFSPVPYGQPLVALFPLTVATTAAASG